MNPEECIAELFPQATLAPAATIRIGDNDTTAIQGRGVIDEERQRGTFWAKDESSLADHVATAKITLEGKNATTISNMIRCNTLTSNHWHFDVDS